MPKKKVGILRGGEGESYVSSIAKGGELITFILEKLSDRWEPFDILIDKSEVWHMKSLPIKPADLMYRVDIVWNMAHPKFSQILDILSIPNISTSSFSKALEDSRGMLEEHLRSAGVNMPKSIIFPIYQEDIDGPKEKYIDEKTQMVFKKFGAPWIVRSFAPGSHIGVRVAKTYPDLKEAIAEGVSQGTSILVEELIDGKVTALHSVSGFRGDDIYVFPSFGFSPEQNQKLANFSKNLHKHLGINNYLKSDIVWHPKRGMYVTAISVSPNLRVGSHFENSSKYVGAEMHHIIEHILEKTLHRK